MSYVFVSYSHKDADYAHKLAEKLQSNGFNVWIDARLDYGSQWPHEIQKRLDACDAFILVMSPRSFESEWVQSELQRAKRKLKPIFPLLLEGDEPWLSTESTQYYDVRGGRFPDDRFYSALGKTVPVSQNPQTFTNLPRPPITANIPSQTKPKKKTNKIGWALAVLGGGAAFLGLCAVIVLGIWLFNLGSPPAAPATQVIFITATHSDAIEESSLKPVASNTPMPTKSPTRTSTSTYTSTATPLPIPTKIPPTFTPVPPTNTPAPPSPAGRWTINANSFEGELNIVTIKDGAVSGTVYSDPISGTWNEFTQELYFKRFNNPDPSIFQIFYGTQIRSGNHFILSGQFEDHNSGNVETYSWYAER